MNLLEKSDHQSLTCYMRKNGQIYTAQHICAILKLLQNCAKERVTISGTKPAERFIQVLWSGSLTASLNETEINYE